nr:protein fuzzy homolog isoform X5 [Taeniopygia guttata]
MDEEGGAFLVGVATASGLPLFCRPPRPQVPFPLVGALHGVHLFGAAAGAELRQAATPTAHLGWAGYGDSLTLIGLSPGPAPARILDSAFGAMVLLLGREQLLPVRNEERLKRELRERLRRFAGAAGTDLGCVVWGGGVAWLSTAPWGALPEADSAPLRALLAPPPPEGALRGGVAARDLPVFLPNSSPEVPLRLLQLRLLPGVGVGLLCGPRPSLQLLLTQLVPQFWGPVLEQLRARPRPPPLPPQVLGYLLIHRGRRQSGILKGAGPGGALPPPLRAAALRRLLRLLEPQICPKSGGRDFWGAPRTPRAPQTLLPGAAHPHRLLPPAPRADSAAAAAPRDPPRPPEPHGSERPERPGARVTPPE